MAPEIIGSLIGAGVNLLSPAINQSYNERNMALQSQYAKDLMDYQWSNFNSPKAQINSLLKAGFNPAVALGGHGSFASPSPSMPSSAPVQLDGIFDVSQMGNFIKSVADAKKAGMDTKLSEQDIKNKEVERQSMEFELGLQKQFGKDFKSVELAQAYRNLLLLSDSHDLNEIEKAIGEYKQQTEKALASAKQSEAEMLKQRLDNNPVLLRLENTLLEEKAKTEKASQASHYSQVEVNRELRRLNSALADVEENTKVDKINSLIKEYQSKGVLSDADAKESEIRLSRLLSIEDKRSSAFFAEVDNLLEWLRNKVRIFH